MNKFTRIHKQDGVTPPKSNANRRQGQTVAVGEPYQIQGDAQFRQDLEESLEIIAKKRLQDAEEKAAAIVEQAQTKAKADATRIANEILEKANAQAKEMLSQTQGQVDEIRENAYEEGFKNGFEEGYTDATNQVEQETVSMLRGVHGLTEKAYAAEKLVLENFEKNALALIEHIAKKVLRREMIDSPEILLHLVKQAVESLYMSGKVKIVANAELIHAVRQFTPNTEAMMDSLKRFEFIADPMLDLTQAYVIGEEGCFDISVDKQVEQLLTPVQDALQFPKPEPTASIDIPTAVPQEPAEIDAPASNGMADEPIASEQSMVDMSTNPASPTVDEAIETAPESFENEPSSVETGLNLPDLPSAETIAENAVEEALMAEPSAEPEALAEPEPFQFEEFAVPEDDITRGETSIDHESGLDGANLTDSSDEPEWLSIDDEDSPDSERLH